VSTRKDAVTGKYAYTSRTWPGYAADDPEVTTADKALAKLVKELEGNRSGSTPGAGVTVDQLLTGWLKQITSEGRSPTTLREYRRLIDKRISPAHGSMPARKVTAPSSWTSSTRAQPTKGSPRPRCARCMPSCVLDSARA
jgi:hypothetical protein